MHCFLLRMPAPVRFQIPDFLRVFVWISLSAVGMEGFSIVFKTEWLHTFQCKRKVCRTASFLSGYLSAIKEYKNWASSFLYYRNETFCPVGFLLNSSKLYVNPEFISCSFSVSVNLATHGDETHSDCRHFMWISLNCHLLLWQILNDEVSHDLTMMQHHHTTAQHKNDECLQHHIHLQLFIMLNVSDELLKTWLLTLMIFL